MFITKKVLKPIMNVCCIELASPKLNQQQQHSTYMYQISKIGLGGLRLKVTVQGGV